MEYGRLQLCRARRFGLKTRDIILVLFTLAALSSAQWQTAVSSAKNCNTACLYHLFSTKQQAKSNYVMNTAENSTAGKPTGQQNMLLLCMARLLKQSE